MVARTRVDKPLGAGDLNTEIELPIDKDPKTTEKDETNGITWSESDDNVVGAVDPGSKAAEKRVKPGWKLVDDRKTQRKQIERQRDIDAKLKKLKEIGNGETDKFKVRKARAAKVHEALTTLEIGGYAKVLRRGRRQR